MWSCSPKPLSNSHLAPSAPHRSSTDASAVFLNQETRARDPQSCYWEIKSLSSNSPQRKAFLTSIWCKCNHGSNNRHLCDWGKGLFIVDTMRLCIAFCYESSLVAVDEPSTLYFTLNIHLQMITFLWGEWGTRSHVSFMLFGKRSFRMGTDKPVDGSGKNPTESDENRKQRHICKYVPMSLLRLYL